LELVSAPGPWHLLPVGAVDVALGGHGRATIRVQDDLGDACVQQGDFETAGLWSYPACLSAGSEAALRHGFAKAAAPGWELVVGPSSCLPERIPPITESPSRGLSPPKSLTTTAACFHFLCFLQWKGSPWVMFDMLSTAWSYRDPSPGTWASPCCFGEQPHRTNARICKHHSL